MMLRDIARSVGAAAVCCAAAACASTATQVAPGSPSSSASTPAASVQGQPVWRGMLMPQNGSTVSGTVTVRPVSDAQTQATLTVAGAPAGGVHPWHIHTGSCAQSGGIVGPPTAYTAVSVGADGTGTVVVTLPFATPTSGAYSVNVHASPSEMGTIVACADLKSGM
jgi:Cu/Zn superoxide dismutase